MNLRAAAIRLATQKDLPSLEWEGEYTHFRQLYREIYQGACDGRALMWVADLPVAGVIGQLFVQLTSGRTELADGKTRAYIYGFRIKPAYRRQGLGRKMLQIAETDLLERRFSWATLNVARDNPAARRLYEAAGYQVVGADPGIWSYIDHQGVRREVNEPAWRMLKQLVLQPVSVNI